MRFALDYRETTQGSFVAQGTGFKYNYDNCINTLRVSKPRKKRALATLKFDKNLSQDPLTYVSALEKATQIKALMFSNNQSINLSNILDCSRLPPILDSAAQLSRFAFDLHYQDLRRFSERFTEVFDLKKVKIKKFISHDQDNEFFIARLQTHHDNTICVRACTLVGITAALSDKTLRDLITMEYGHRFENSAQNLLLVSSKLSSISYILDENFIPHAQLLPEIHSKKERSTH